MNSFMKTEGKKKRNCRTEELIKEYPKLADEDAKNLERGIAVKEATCALKPMKNGGKAQDLMDLLSNFPKSFPRRDQTIGW